MKKTISFLTLMCLVTLFSVAQKAPSVSKTSFSAASTAEYLLDMDGGKHLISSILEKNKGQAVLLYVWASWCPDCLQGFPELTALQKQNPDLKVIYFSRDRVEENWKNCIAKFDLQGTHYWFGNSSKNAFTEYVDLDWIPRYILIDPQGQIKKYYTVKADDPELQAAIDQL